MAHASSNGVRRIAGTHLRKARGSPVSILRKHYSSAAAREKGHPQSWTFPAGQLCLLGQPTGNSTAADAIQMDAAASGGAPVAKGEQQEAHLTREQIHEADTGKACGVCGRPSPVHFCLFKIALLSIFACLFAVLLNFLISAT